MSRIVAGVEFAYRWWACLCGVLLLLVVVLALLALSRQKARDHDFVQAELVPLAQFVISYREAHGQLPTEGEFKEWTAKNRAPGPVEYYPQRPGFVSEWGTPGRDFLVGAWRGKWMVYYQSWDGRDFAGEMPSIMHSPAHG